MEQREHGRFKCLFLAKNEISFIFFYLKELKLGIFPAECKFVVVKSSTQNLCFCSTVLKVGANIHAVKFFSWYLICFLCLAITFYSTILSLTYVYTFKVLQCTLHYLWNNTCCLYRLYKKGVVFILLECTCCSTALRASCLTYFLFS